MLQPQPQTPFRTLRNPLAAAAASLEDRIIAFEQAIVASRGWSLDAVNTGSASDVYVVGRICTDGGGGARTSQASLHIEGSRETSRGARASLDVSLLTDFSLFPGQVVGVCGRNPTGSCVTAHELVDALPPRTQPRPQGHADEQQERGDLRLIVATGPFVQPDQLAWGPLHTVLQYCSDHQPGMLLLCGPFVPDTHPGMPHAQATFQELFERQVLAPLQAFQQQHPGVVIALQPAMSDAHHIPVHPQPPFQAVNGIDMLPSPAHVQVAGCTVSATASAVIMHVSASEVSKQV
jgi:DNA polymerase alpha subunit B